MIIELFNDVIISLAHICARYFILFISSTPQNDTIKGKVVSNLKMTQLILSGNVLNTRHLRSHLLICNPGMSHPTRALPTVLQGAWCPGSTFNVSSCQFTVKDPWTFFLAPSWPFAAIIIKIKFWKFSFFNQRHSIFDHLKEWLNVRQFCSLGQFPRKKIKSLK